MYLSKHNLEKKISDSFKRGFYTAVVSIIKKKPQKTMKNISLSTNNISLILLLHCNSWKIQAFDMKAENLKCRGEHTNVRVPRYFASTCMLFFHRNAAICWRKKSNYLIHTAPQHTSAQLLNSCKIDKIRNSKLQRDNSNWKLLGKLAGITIPADSESTFKLQHCGTCGKNLLSWGIKRRGIPITQSGAQHP